MCLSHPETNIVVPRETRNINIDICIHLSQVKFDYMETGYTRTPFSLLGSCCSVPSVFDVDIKDR